MLKNLPGSCRFFRCVIFSQPFPSPFKGSNTYFQSKRSLSPSGLRISQSFGSRFFPPIKFLSFPPFLPLLPPQRVGPFAGIEVLFPPSVFLIFSLRTLRLRVPFSGGPKYVHVSLLIGPFHSPSVNIGTGGFSFLFGSSFTPVPSMHSGALLTPLRPQNSPSPFFFPLRLGDPLSSGLGKTMMRTCLPLLVVSDSHRGWGVFRSSFLSPDVAQPSPFSPDDPKRYVVVLSFLSLSPSLQRPWWIDKGLPPYFFLSVPSLRPAPPF